MEVFTIPIDNKYIIYRPLRQLAFVGNQTMAELAKRVAETAADENASANLSMNVPEEIWFFLQGIGFLEPDPPEPAPPDHDYQPTTAVLLLTNRCHLRCIYCYANAGMMPAHDLDWHLAQVVIDRVCENAMALGHPNFALSLHGGGEPVMAWSLIKQATAYARSKPLPCSISLTSNGMWSEQQASWIIENLDNVSLSIDGAPATQDHQRPAVAGQGSSNIVRRTIARLDAANFNYGIRMTATAPFRNRLPADVKFLCQETNCRAFQVEPAFNVERGEHKRPELVEADDFIEGFMAAFEIAAQANRQLTYSGARPWLLTQAFCNAPYAALVVNPSGQLVSCYEVTNDKHPLSMLSAVGQIVQHQISVDHLTRERLLSRMDERRALCSSCFCRWHCAGDCYVRGFGAEGDHTEFGTRCMINRNLTAHLLLWYIMQGDGVWQGQTGAAMPATSPVQAMMDVKN